MATALSGAPRPREPAPGATSARAASDVVRGAWLAAASASAFGVWGAAATLFVLLEGRVAGAHVALFGILPAAVAFLAFGGAFAVRRRAGGEARALLALSSVAGTALLALAVAGHVLHARGEALRPLFGEGWPLAWRAPALFAAVLGAPLVGGLLARAAGRALDVAGASPWRPTLDGRALALGLLEGLALPGLLLLDVVLTLTVARKERHARIHLDAPLPRVKESLERLGWRVATLDGGLACEPPGSPEGAPAASLKPRRLHFPRCDASRLLVLEGPTDARVSLRLALERDAAFCGRASWTAAARRLEARVDALAREEEDAWSHEERGALLETLASLEAGLRLRPLLADEWGALLWKVEALKARLLREPPTPLASERRPLAPAPALAPDLTRILDAGGLSATARLLYVPHHLVRVRTAIGEAEVAVNALTQEIDLAESRALLRALESRGADLRAHGTRAAFAPAPAPTAALLGDVRTVVRRAWGPRRTEARLEDVELLYVPFVEREDGWANAVTGRACPSLADALSRAGPVA